MSKDPIDRNLLRMEIRRFQTRCEAQEGTIRRADTLREVARLANIAVPFPLNEETAALDARNQVRRTAEERARELIDEMLDHLMKAEAGARAKIRHNFDDALLNLTGPLNSLRTWAQGRLASTEQSLSD